MYRSAVSLARASKAESTCCGVMGCFFGASVTMHRSPSSLLTGHQASSQPTTGQPT